MIEKYNVPEHIRKRPGMYIGSLDHSGFNELIYHLIQDFIETEFYEITFLLKENNHLIIESTGRKNSRFISDAIRNINDYHNGHFYFSIATIVALSENLAIEINDVPVLHADKGVFEMVDQITDDVNKIKFDFKADKDIFIDLSLNYRHLNSVFKRFSFLNSKLKIRSIDESTHELQINIFHYPKGLSEIIDFELMDNFMYDSTFFRMNLNRITDFSYSLSLAFIGGWSLKPKIKVYANYKETILGGSLLDGILQGFKKFLKEEVVRRNLTLNISETQLKKHLLLYASVNGDLTYSGSTRWKLGTPEVQREIEEFVYQELKSCFADKEDTLTDILDVFADND